MLDRWICIYKLYLPTEQELREEIETEKIG
jgi:hypothetical protein